MLYEVITDRMILPVPFSRGIFIYGEPIRLEDIADLDAVTRSIEVALTRVADAADAAMSHPPLVQSLADERAAPPRAKAT